MICDYIGSAESHEYHDLQVGDEVNPSPFFGGGGNLLCSSGKILRSVGNVTADAISTIIRILRGNRSRVSIVQTKGIWATKTRRFLKSQKTGRAARSIPHPLGWRGRTQFDLQDSDLICRTDFTCEAFLSSYPKPCYNISRQ
jgi:hypothetical protein